MGHAVRDHRNQRRIRIRPAGNANAGSVAGFRLAAIGGNGERRAEHPAIGKGQGRGHVVTDQAGDFSWCDQRDFGRRAHRRQQRGPQQAILQHDAERITGIARIEMQKLRRRAIGDANGANRAAIGIEHLAQPQRPQHPRRGAGDGAGAAIERLCRRCVEVLRIDDDARHFVARQGEGKGGADQPAPDDDDICVHALCLAAASRR